MFILSKIEFATPEYDEMVALRTLVLRKPLGLEYTIEQLAGEYDDELLVAYDEQMRLCGCLILTKIDDEKVKMRQVAVHFDYQNKGIGTLLVRHSEWLAEKKGFKKIELHARENAFKFYEKLAYNRSGAIFSEVNIPHLKFYKDL